MKFKNIIGQAFRNATEMPFKVNEYNAILNKYQEIIDLVTQIENDIINYLTENNDYNWIANSSLKIKFDADYANGRISSEDYVSGIQYMEEEKQRMISSFIASNDSYFIKLNKEKLYTIKKRYTGNQFVALMSFDTWDDMKQARDLAKIAILQIRADEDYIDSKAIAEIEQGRRIDNHIRKRG